MTTNGTVLGWHFLSEMKLANGDGREVKVGEWIEVEGAPRLCGHGLHASERIIDALGYASGNLCCRVELGGKIVRDHDKIVAQRRRVLWVVDSLQVLVEFAGWAAIRAGDYAGLQGDPAWASAWNDWNHAVRAKNWDAADVAADAAAARAARAARAAGAAAWNAAEAAAWAAGAARAAAWAAWDAARAAARAAGAAARDVRASARAAARAAWAAWDAVRAAGAAEAAAEDEMDAYLVRMMQLAAGVPETAT